MLGANINLEPKSRMLSPVLRNAGKDKFRAIIIGYNETEDFSTIDNALKRSGSEKKQIVPHYYRLLFLWVRDLW